MNAPVSEPTSDKSGLPWTKIAIGVVALIAFIAAYRLLPIAEWVEAFRTWVTGLGPLGWVVFVIVYGLTTFALVPGSILTLAAGVAFGLWGFPIVILGATFGSALSFLAARYVFHDRVQEKVSDYPKFDAVNQAIGDEGWRVVGLLRLSPALPFSLAELVSWADARRLLARADRHLLRYHARHLALRLDRLAGRTGCGGWA